MPAHLLEEVEEELDSTKHAAEASWSILTSILSAQSKLEAALEIATCTVIIIYYQGALRIVSLVDNEPVDASTSSAHPSTSRP